MCQWAGEDPELVISFTSYMVLIHAHLPQWRVLYRASDHRLFNCKPITWPHTAIYKPITPSKHPVFSDHHYSPAARSFPSTKYELPANLAVWQENYFCWRHMLAYTVCSLAWPPGAGLGRSLCLKRRLNGKNWELENADARLYVELARRHCHNSIYLFSPHFAPTLLAMLFLPFLPCFFLLWVAFALMSFILAMLQSCSVAVSN